MMLTVDTGSMQYTEAELQALAEGRRGLWQQFQEDLKQGSLPISLPLRESAELPEIKKLAGHLNQSYRNVLLLGIGGSALGARTLLQFFRGPYYHLQPQGGVRLFILDNIDSAAFRELQELLDFRETALVYVSKSGSTPETAAAFLFFFDLYIRAGGRREDVVMICDPAENGANRVASRLQCRFIALNPLLPGRYSVLSPAGLLPGELLGIDGKELLEGARRVEQSLSATPLASNPLGLLGLMLHDSALNRQLDIHVLFNYSSRLAEFGLWFSQLWGESLGKALDLQGSQINSGTTPLPCVGATDQHSLLQLFREGPADKVYGFIHLKPGPEAIHIPCSFESEVEFAYFAGQDVDGQLEIERMCTEISLASRDCPCYSIELADRSPASLGALLYFYQALVVWSARLWNINPFNQPGVELGKQMTYALMGRADCQGDLPRVREAVGSYMARRRSFYI